MRGFWLLVVLVLAGCSATAPPAAGEAAVPPQAPGGERSVVRVSGEAPSCAMRIEGTGFVYAPQRVVAGVIPVSSAGSGGVPGVITPVS